MYTHMADFGSNSLMCGRSLEDCLRTIEQFHNWKAPGLVLGLIMVDWALEQIGPEVEADAIVETRYCLPDAIQLFTPCTVGNGWLKILDWDKFALSLYDRRELNGYRVWFDLEKARKYPELYNWYMRLVPKRDLPLEVLLEVILAAKRSVLSSRMIRMSDFFKRTKKGDTAVCSGCGEAYRASQGNQCTACQGGAYFEYQAG